MAQNGAYRRIGGVLYLLKPRDYVVTVVHDAAASTMANGIIAIDPSSIFIMTDRFITDTNDPTTAAPGLQGQYENLVSIQDSSNGYNWSNDFVPRSAFARTREHGYRLPDEVMIAQNTRLTVTFKNPAAASAAGTSTLILQGYSLYPVSE
jgi:hypothetical protein